MITLYLVQMTQVHLSRRDVESAVQTSIMIYQSDGTIFSGPQDDCNAWGERKAHILDFSTQVRRLRLTIGVSDKWMLIICPLLTWW